LSVKIMAENGSNIDASCGRRGRGLKTNDDVDLVQIADPVLEKIFVEPCEEVVVGFWYSEVCEDPLDFFVPDVVALFLQQ